MYTTSLNRVQSHAQHTFVSFNHKSSSECLISILLFLGCVLGQLLAGGRQVRSTFLSTGERMRSFPLSWGSSRVKPMVTSWWLFPTLTQGDLVIKIATYWHCFIRLRVNLHKHVGVSRDMREMRKLTGNQPEKWRVYGESPLVHVAVWKPYPEVLFS